MYALSNVVLFKEIVRNVSRTSILWKIRLSHNAIQRQQKKNPLICCFVISSYFVFSKTHVTHKNALMNGFSEIQLFCDEVIDYEYTGFSHRTIGKSSQEFWRVLLVFHCCKTASLRTTVLKLFNFSLFTQLSICSDLLIFV